VPSVPDHRSVDCRERHLNGWTRGNRYQEIRRAWMVQARNMIAAKSIAAEHIPTDDQYTLMAAHQDLHRDDVHFKPEGSAIQARQVAATILAALGK